VRSLLQLPNSETAPLENAMRRRTVLGSLCRPARRGSAERAAAADATTTIDHGRTGCLECWGTSLCWWGKAHGNRDDLADIFFTRNHRPVPGQALPGLGLNIARTTPAPARPTDQRRVDGPLTNIGDRADRRYWLDWFSSDPSSAS